MEPLAAVTLPVLEWRCEWVGFNYVESDRSQPNAPAARAALANLPVSFSALRLYTTSICIEIAEDFSGAVLNAAEDEEVVAGAEELCRVLSLAPACYQEFRVYADMSDPAITIAVMVANGDRTDHIDYGFDDLPTLAEAVHCVASVHGLGAGMSHDETYLRIDRVGRRQVREVRTYIDQATGDAGCRHLKYLVLPAPWRQHVRTRIVMCIAALCRPVSRDFSLPAEAKEDVLVSCTHRPSEDAHIWCPASASIGIQ